MSPRPEQCSLQKPISEPERGKLVEGRSRYLTLFVMFVPRKANIVTTARKCRRHSIRETREKALETAQGEP